MGFFDSKSILITGGTGSLGRQIVKKLLNESATEKIVVLSRDELKQSEMSRELNSEGRLRWFLGDVRDEKRLQLAFKDIDIVIHCAALKQVDTAEYNPLEFIKTNILGSQNVITAALANSVPRVLSLSTDKASSPINLYGATKLTADKLFISSNSYSGSGGTRFSVVRYGNVVGSRGSVIPLFLKLARNGQNIPLTDLTMTRFWITIEQATEFVLENICIMQGGELFVPLIPSARIEDIANYFAQKFDVDVFLTSIRPGEKIHEEMVSDEDARRTFEVQNRLIITPTHLSWPFTPIDSSKVLDGGYKSNTNKLWLKGEALEELIEATIMKFSP